MSTTASVQIIVSFSGDVTGQIPEAAADNVTALGKDDLISLSSGNNTITIPVVTGFSVTGVEIIPPSGNTNLITVKGVNGDTGVPLHKTNPTFLALDSTAVTFVLNAANTINGVRLIWT